MNAIPMLLQCRQHQYPFSRWEEIRDHGEWLSRHGLRSQPEEWEATLFMLPEEVVLPDPVVSPVELWAGDLGLDVTPEDWVGW